MQGTVNYQSLLILSILAFFTPIALRAVKRIRIPFVVGEIFVGLIVGKSGFNIVASDTWILFLSNLGLAYLMYLSGFEIDFSPLSSPKTRKGALGALKTSLLMFLMAFAVAFAVASGFEQAGLVRSRLFFAFLLSATAPGLLVPIFKERKLSDTDFGQTLLVFSLICEFICLIAMTFVSSSLSQGMSYKNFLFMVVVGVSLLLFLAARYLLKRFSFSLDTFSGVHLEIRASFAVILILVAVSEAVGVEIVFGSFIAGVIFSIISGRAREDIKDKVDIIGYGFLVPIFFIEIGVNINIRTLFAHPMLLLMLPVLLAVFFAVKILPSLLLSKRFGFKKAFSSSFLLSAQLSLMIVGLQIALSMKLIDDAVYSLFIFAAIISCLLCPVLFDKLFDESGLLHRKNSNLDRVCMRETALNNPHLFGLPLKNIAFPPSCRILMIIRGEKEILPNGETVLEPGDLLLLAGVKANEKKMMKLVESETELSTSP